MSWHTLIGTPKQYAGTAGTVTLNSGEIVMYVSAYSSSASATVAILGGPAIQIPQSNATNPAGIWWVQFYHTLFMATPSVNTLVFTNTTHYYVHTVHQGHASA